MPTGNGFTTGNDSAVVIIGASGRIDFKTVTAFESKPMTTDTKVRPLGRNAPLFDEQPDGHEGSFDIVRAGTSVEDHFSTAEALWYATGVLSNVSIFHTITEAAGVTSVWQFDNAALKLNEGGSFKNNEDVKMKVSFKASTKKRVS